MNDLDNPIHSTLHRLVTTSPPPVSVEAILARSETAAGVNVTARRRARLAPGLTTVALGTAAVVALAVFVAGWQPESAVDVQAGGDTTTAEGERPEANAPTDADVETWQVSIPEGGWLSEVIPALADQLPHVSADDLWSALEETEPQSPFTSSADLNSVDVPDMSPARVRWEGLLPTGSFTFSADDTATDIVDTLHGEFVRTAADLGFAESGRTGDLTGYELVVIASLVESADAATDVDRAKIATVIHNRLDQSLPVGVDDPYFYQTQDRDLDLTPSVLGSTGPYSTRRTVGLPPTPIGLPSTASLQAAITPTPGPWLYYSPADDDGNYDFAATLEEHSANVAAARDRAGGE